MTGGAWALIMLAGGQLAVRPPRRGQPRADAPITSATGAPFRPDRTRRERGPRPDPDASTGPTGQVRVSWTVLRTVYTATLTTDGPTGTAEVSYDDRRRAGRPTLIRQDLTFVSSGDRLAYVGSNPRDAATDVATGGYRPTRSCSRQTTRAASTSSRSADDSGICAPATML